MPRYALLVEYDGAPFVGWQRQAIGLSVQQVLEEAAAPLNGGVPALTQASGRTDAGVHAEGQVVQIELGLDLPPLRLREALNAYSRPHPVSVVAAARVPEEWSARFSCIGRSYRYRILNRRARPALLAGRVWHVPQAVDADAMHAAAQTILGRHDFTAFRAAACQAKDALRTLDQLDVRREGDEILVHTAARSFLHHQVRNMVGSLMQVGLGRRPVPWVRELLDGRDRTLAGQNAPAEGLTFLAARYPAPIDWC
ncbi:tRNA pseudouridine(38-40) synthase TruA [Roseomonas sp. 18066]|uniref:tRNA pseudouridine(38-40) synthase TruA n=1 Tax=Roseomonas sp. 18066 TaxID=2681412 RepID=UPI001358DAB7|nr:tRNA pseudouridine(38-40) synthase TruA [Roseomonas sp. 18066]